MSRTKTYPLELTTKEFEGLAWISDRYCSAAVLIDGVYWQAVDEDGQYILDDEEGTPALMVGRVPSGVMWGYIAALHALEDYDFPPPPYPPCAGGTLAEKLTALVQSFPTDMQFRGIEHRRSIH